MKKGFAIAMSAVLAATSSLPVMAESEEVFSPVTYAGEFAITSQEETLTLSISAAQPAEDFLSFSAAVTVPASLMGTEEDVVYGLDDVVRIIAGDTYINVTEVMSLYEELTGASMSYLLPFVGINQDWIEIPALEFVMDDVIAEAEEESEAEDEIVMNELLALMDYITIEEAEDGTTTISFDGEAVVAAVEAFENLYYASIEDTKIDVSDIDIQMLCDTFSDYILAAAEGINAVTPEISIEDAQANVIEMIEEFASQMSSIIVVEPLETEDGERLAETLRQAFDAGAQFNAVMVISDEGMNANISLEADGEKAVADINFDGTTFNCVVTDGETQVASANGTLSMNDDGFAADFVFESEGESVALNALFALTDNGVSASLKADDGVEPVEFAFNFGIFDGVTLEDTQTPQATLLRDVVKTTVILIYGSSIQEEEVELQPTVELQ